MKKAIYLFVFGAMIFSLTSCEKDNSFEEVDFNTESVDRGHIRRPGSQSIEGLLLINSKNSNHKNEPNKD